MMTVKSWEIIIKKQEKLDQLIVQKSPVDLKWISRSNVERLKLALLVEVGEFANEIKSFKAWRKKAEIDWTKAKEELIDCLGYFLGLISIYQIDMLPSLHATGEKEEQSFNELLLDFFAKTNDLYVEKNEQFYNLKNNKINDKAKNNYYDWLSTFNQTCQKLKIDENELMEVYLAKNKINQGRAQEK